MIDLTLSSSDEDEAPAPPPPKRPRGPPANPAPAATARAAAAAAPAAGVPASSAFAVAAAAPLQQQPPPRAPAAAAELEEPLADAAPAAPLQPRYVFTFDGEDTDDAAADAGGAGAAAGSGLDGDDGDARPAARAAAAAAAATGGARRRSAAAAAAATGDEYDEPGGRGGDDEDAPAAPKRRGGGGRRLTPEERAEREAAKAADKAAKVAAKAREKEEKAAAKAAEKEAAKERKAAEKEAAKHAKAAQKGAARAAKDAADALKPSHTARFMRLVLSNALASSPLGVALCDMAREGTRSGCFGVEVHRALPLAAHGVKYCMWGVRVPAAAGARLRAAEGCALEAADALADPQGGDLPLFLFPALLLVLSGEELIARLEADTAAPLAGLHAQVASAHPAASLLVYGVGLHEALTRRERANRSFVRGAIHDLLLDVALGMPAVRLQYDCPEGDLQRAAADVLNYGHALSQQPRKRMEAYLEHFATGPTLPLQELREGLREEAGDEAVAAAEALSCLVAPQRAAAVARRYPSLAAVMEALRAAPSDKAREGLLAGCRIPGSETGRYRQTNAGPACAASVARFLTLQDGRQEWMAGGGEGGA